MTSTSSGSSEGAAIAKVFCSCCGQPLDELGEHYRRREADWKGVRIRLSEKVFIAAVIGLANAAAALFTVLTR